MTRQALTGLQRELGPDHPTTLEVMHNLSMRLAELGQHEEAAEVAQQALEGRQRMLGPEHPHTLASKAYREHRVAELEQCTALPHSN